MAEHDDGPITWVAPGDSDEEHADDPSASSDMTQADTLDDPLLGHVERLSNEGQRFLAARKHHGTAVDIRYENFDPLLYLATVHRRTPLAQVETSAERLRAMAKKGGKVTSDSKKLIHANFGRFVAAQDKMMELRTIINAADGPDAILDKLLGDLTAIEEAASRTLAPILALQSESAGVRSGLSVLERHHSLFQLPSLIKEESSAGRYDRVVATYARAQEMLGDSSYGVLGRLREEVLLVANGAETIFTRSRRRPCVAL
jgi:hypothetical protein